MLEVSFQDEVGPFEGTLISAGPADQTAIALAGEDTLDDICSQIRVFRSTFSGGKDWPADSAPFSASPERSATFGWNLSQTGTISSPASVSRPNWSQQALSTASTSSTAHGLLPSTRQPILRVDKMKSVSFADVERHRLDLAARDHDASTSLSPVRAPRMRMTMWQERQLEACFHRWASLRPAMSATPSLADVHVIASPRVMETRATPSSPGFASQANRRLRNLSFRGWHRICAQRTAEEFSVSLKLLDSQVSKQLRRGLARWWTWSQASKGRQVVRKHQNALRRAGLRSWHNKAVLSARRRVVRDQVCALLRAWFLRHSARLWAAKAKKMKRYRSHPVTLSLLRQSFAAWRRLKWCNEVFLNQAIQNAKIMLARTKRLTMRQWLDRSRQRQQRRLLVLVSRRNLVDRQRRDALRTLSRTIARKQDFNRGRSSAKHRARYRCQSIVFLAWSRWSYKGLQLRRLYEGHRISRVRNEMQPIFDTWISMVRREQRQRVALQRANIVMALSFKRRSFHCWHAMLHSRRKGMKVLLALAATPLSLFFNCWFQAVAMLKKERRFDLMADRHYARGVKFRALSLFIVGHAASRLEYQQEARAESSCRRRAMANCLMLWHAGVTMARVEREQFAHATKRHVTVLGIRIFSLWRSNAVEFRWEREHHAVADTRQRIRFMRLAWTSWCSYSAFKRQKRHTPKAEKCMELGKALRRRCHLQGWYRVFRSAQRQRHITDHRNLSALRAFFGWGALARQRSELAEGLVSTHMQGTDLRRCQRVWDAWTDFVTDAMVETAKKMSVARNQHGQGLLYIGLWALHENVLQNAVARRKITSLTNSLKVLVDWEHHQAKYWSIGTWWDWVEHERRLDEVEIELANMNLRQTCFDGWAKYCERIGHKRMVHEVCDNHHFGRLLVRTFEGWRNTQLHLVEVIEAVHRWADGVEVQRGLDLFEVWQGWARHRRRCRRAANKVVAERKLRILSTWTASLRKQQTTWLVMQRAFQNQRLAVFRSWRERATFKASQARRGRVLSEAVHSTRRRRWIEHWVEAARWKRLGQVATSWDQQSFSSRALIAVLHAWSGMTALLALRPKLEQRIASLRAQAHLRVWGKLSRMLGVYCQTLGRLAISGWDKFILQRKHQIRAAQKCTDTRTRWYLKTWRGFKRSHKEQRERMNHCFGAASDMIRRVQLKQAIANWNLWSNPKRQVRQTIKNRKSGQPGVLKTAEAKGFMLRTSRQHRFFSTWHDAWLRKGSRTGTPHIRPGDIVHQPLPDPHFSPRISHPQLKIKISQTHDVQASSCLSGKFCMCETLSSQPGHFQKKISDTTSPVWGEAFTHDPYKIGESLSLKMMGKDYIWPKPDVLLGSAILECDDFYPFGFRGDVHLLSDGKPVGTLNVQIDVVNAPHLRIRRVAPTVARVIVPATRSIVFMEWKKYFKRLKAADKFAENLQIMRANNRRARIFLWWYDAFDHKQAAYFATRMLIRKHASRLFRRWAEFAGLQKRLAIHWDQLGNLENTKCVQKCFKVWCESMNQHYEVALMWLNRWRRWCSEILLNWLGYVRDQQYMRRKLRELQRGAKHLQKCRKADLLNLCRLSSVLRACFAAYAEWSRKEALIRQRSAQLEERVSDGRQRRRLCLWAACGRSAAQDDEETKLVGLRCLLPSWAHEYATRSPPLAIGKPDLVGERHAAYVQGIAFALWSDFMRTRRPMQQAARSLSMIVRARRKLRGVAFWRHWAQKQRSHGRILTSHWRRWGGLTLWPFLVAWWRTVRISLAVASVHYAKAHRLAAMAWNCWESQRSRSKQSYRVATALHNVQESHVAREVLWSWVDCASRDAKVRRLVRNFEAARSRWTSEETWRKNASADPTLQAMFCRFASAFDSHRAESAYCSSSSQSTVSSLPRASGFNAVLTLIWSRQQLSVALARLRGQQQAWMLDMWPLNLSPMLHPQSNDYMQVERRFPVMVRRLEEESSVAYATSIVRASHRKSQQPMHTGSMWFALADLLVLHYPGWPSQSREPVVPRLAKYWERPKRERQHENNEAFLNSSLPPDATPHFGACRSVEPCAVGTSSIYYEPLARERAVMAVR